MLVTLDTTRADHIGCYGASGASTPVIDGLAAQGARFESAFTLVPITLPSHATILTGLPPALHGVHDNVLDRLPDGIPTLSEILKERGYETGAFIGAAVLAGRYGLARGFDRYDDDLIGTMKEVATLSFVERRAEHVTRSALAWLAERSPERPFLLWAHYFDPHGDYVPPPPFAEKFRERPYDGEIAYVDHWLGELLAEVARRAGTRPVLTIVVADHGEGLGEHGEQAHGIFIYDSTMRVPLVIHFPGRVAPGVVVPDLVGTQEILPTALDLIGIPVPRSVEAESMVPLLRGQRARREPLFLETMLPKNLIGWTAIEGLRTAELKYVESPNPELYDLERDPRETANAARERAAEAEDLGKRLSAYRAAAAGRGSESSRPAEIDEATRQRLAALGYAVDAEPGGTPEGRDPKDLVELFNNVFGSIELVSQRRWNEARTLLERVLELHPRHVGAMVNIGETYRRRALEGTAAEKEPTDLANAEKWFERALATDPGWAPGHLGLGRVLAGRGDLERALEHFRRATEIRPESLDARTEMALLLARRGEIAKATEELENVVRVHPEQGDPHRHLGALYRAAGRDGDALREYELAVRLAPNDPAARFLLGRLLRDLGRLEEAAESFAAAIRINPQAAYARVDLGDLYYRVGKREAARWQFEAATQIAESAANAYHGLGMVDMADGDLEAAEASFRAALDRRPDLTSASLNLAVVLERRGSRDRALETLRQAQARDPGNEELKKRLSELEGGGAAEPSSAGLERDADR